MCERHRSFGQYRKEKLLEQLIIKFLNAHFGVDLDVYKERNTGCQLKNCMEGTHRGSLKAKTAGTEVKLNVEKMKVEKGNH